MTEPRHASYDETPFGAWVRRQSEIESRRTGLSVTDIDWCFHKFKTSVDRLGTREIQLMLMVELKTYNAEPSYAQLDDLYQLHQIMATKKKVKRLNGAPVSLWHFGVHVLSLPQTLPAHSYACRWGRFSDDGRLCWRSIPTAQLTSLLGFRMNPDTFTPLELRRHHASRAVITRVQTDLGFWVDTIVWKRS